jgi:hypothetical protein
MQGLRCLGITKISQLDRWMLAAVILIGLSVSTGLALLIFVRVSSHEARVAVLDILLVVHALGVIAIVNKFEKKTSD